MGEEERLTAAFELVDRVSFGLLRLEPPTSRDAVFNDIDATTIVDFSTHLEPSGAELGPRSSSLLLLQHRIVVVLSARTRLLLILPRPCTVLAGILLTLVEQTESAKSVSYSLGAVTSAREVERVGTEL